VSGAFRAPLNYLHFKDCNGKIVFNQLLEESKEKIMKRFIQNALMKLSNLYKALNYKYNGTKAESNIGMKSIKEEVVEVRSGVEKVAAPMKEINSETSVKFLYAQPVANGYH
jgi:hypothetical protein